MPRTRIATLVVSLFLVFYARGSTAEQFATTNAGSLSLNTKTLLPLEAITDDEWESLRSETNLTEKPEVFESADGVDRVRIEAIGRLDRQSQEETSVVRFWFRRQAREGVSHWLLTLSSDGIGWRQDNEKLEIFELTSQNTMVPLSLLVVGRERTSCGMNTCYPRVPRTLVDFRPNIPRVLASLSYSWPEGGGACTAIDYGFQPSQELACDFVAGADDALCRLRFGQPRPAVNEEGERSFWLCPDLELPIWVHPPFLEDFPATALTELGLVAIRSGESDFVEKAVPPLGIVRVVFKGAWKGHSGAWVLLHAGVADRWFVVLARPGWAPELREIGTVESDETAEPPYPSPRPRWDLDSLRLDGKILYRVTPFLARPSNFQLFSVLESVDAKTEFRRLSWLGVDSSADEPIFDMISLADEEPSYDHCGVVWYPAGATEVTIKKAWPLLATARVEPEWHSGGANETTDEPGEIEIVWRYGFQTEWVRHRPRSEPARVPKLSEDGSLGSQSVSDLPAPQTYW